MDILKALQQAAAQPKRKTFREQTLAQIEHHERRLRDAKEILAIIDDVGEERLERLSALTEDRVADQPEGPHGPGCTCDPEEEEGVTCH